MRPPTRSTRSVRPSSNKTTAIANARRSRGTSSPPTPLEPSGTNSTTPPPNPNLKPQPIIAAAAAIDDAKVDPGTSPGGGPTSALPPPPPPLAPPVIGCFSVLRPPSAGFEGDESPLVPVVPHYVGYSPTFLGKPSRPRHRMSSDKLETLDAFFRRNTHPSRKEKEVICKALDMDLKTVTIWFQNKRQTVARSRKLQVPEDASTATSTAAMDMLASASAKMTPLAVTTAAAITTTAKPSASALSSTSATSTTSVQLGSDTGRPRRLERSLSLDASVSRRLQRTASSRDSVPEFFPLAPSRVRLSATVRDSNVFGLAQAEPSSGRLSPDLRKPHLGRTGSWPIHPEDLWKHIPSSPALPAVSSPDVSPDVDTPSRGSKFSVQRPRTLEWACARSAKRRRTNLDHEQPIEQEDGETDSECNSMDRSDTCHPSFSISEARVPLEYYDEYPLDVVRGAVLLLGLRDSTHSLAS